jgi:hypothetical protein
MGKGETAETVKRVKQAKRRDGGRFRLHPMKQ